MEVYKVTKKLGEGSFGVVYLGKHIETGEEFAVKMIDKVEATKENINIEVDIHSQLDHPRIIKFKEMCATKVFTCVVMQLCRGGDLIKGMMRHWKSKGMIDLGVVRMLASQMWDCINYMHSLSCVHRDIKGDNFLMELPEVDSPNQSIYLSDFGTARFVKEGERMKEKCGTDKYWSPEFVQRNYGIKVDCWAIGVLMYGLFSGKFPFNTQEDIKSKVLRIPSRIATLEDGKDLLVAALDRDEDKRITAKEACDHKFIAQKEPISPQGTAGPDDDPPIPGQFHDTGANAGIKERRRELMERMQVAQQGASQRCAQTIADGFLVEEPGTKHTLRFQWWKAADAASMLTSFESAQPMPAGSGDEEVTSQDIRKLLVDHNVSMDHFGKGQAKTFESLVDEIQSGKSRLLLDATKHKELVRVVDIVLLCISWGPEGQEQFLLETEEKLPDGRKRENTNQLPGNKKAPHENTAETAQRLARDMLKMDDCKIEFDFAKVQEFEEEEQSPSYPGIRTVYKKELVRGRVVITDLAVLKRFGAGMKNGNFCSEDSQRYTRSYVWHSARECETKGVRLVRPPTKGDISALVYPPIGLEEQEAQRFLEESKIDLSKWGTGTHKSVAEFSEELVKGEASLLKQADGKLLRVVDIVVLKIVNSSGDVLVEVEETFEDSKETRQRLPAIKRRSDEHQFLAARRLVTRFLRLDDFSVVIDPDDVRIIDEKRDSTSYSGLPTLYRKRFMTAKLLKSGRIIHWGKTTS